MKTKWIIKKLYAANQYLMVKTCLILQLALHYFSVKHQNEINIIFAI